MQHHRNSFVSQPTMSRYMPLTPELASAYALNVQNALQSPLSPTLEHLSFSPTLEHPPHITDAGSPVNPFKAAPVCSPHDHEWLGMFSLDDDTTEQLPPRDPPAPMRNPLALRVSTNMPEIAAVSPLHNAFDPDMSRRFVDEEETLLLTPFSASTTHSASTPRFPTSHSFSSCGTSTNCIATGSCSDSRTSTSAASNGKSALKEQLQFLRAQLHLQQFERQSQLDYLGTLEIQLDSMQAAMEDGDMDVVNASADTQESAVAGTIDSEMRQFVHLDAGDTDVTDDMNTAEGNVTVASDDEFDL